MHQHQMQSYVAHGIHRVLYAKQYTVDQDRWIRKPLLLRNWPANILAAKMYLGILNFAYKNK